MDLDDAQFFEHDNKIKNEVDQENRKKYTIDFI